MCEVGSGLNFAAPPRSVVDPGAGATVGACKQSAEKAQSATPTRIPPGDVASLLSESEESEAAELIKSQNLATCEPRVDWI